VVSLLGPTSGTSEVREVVAENFLTELERPVSN